MSETDGAGASLSFGVLGPFEAAQAGTGLALGGRQQRAILALLVCEAGRLVSVERLIQGVWGDSAPAGAVASVQTYVFHLRQLLEPGRPRGSPGSVLVTVPGGYRLSVDRQAIDLTRFEGLVASADAALERGDPQRASEAYTEALELWRGDVLADLSDYDFVAHLRTRLDEQRASVLESRVQAELDLGHHLAANSELGGLITEYPLREGLHALRILALYRSGRQSDALAAYRELCRVLDAELGIEPSPPLRELHTRVLRQDPTLAWHRPDVPVDAVDLAAEPLPRVPMPSPVTPSEARTRTHRRRRRLGAVAAVLVVVAALTGSATIQVLDAPAAAAAMLANGVSEVDASGSVLASVPVGTNPIAVASGGGAIWVVNASDDTVSRVDPSTHSVRQDIEVGHDPRALVVTGKSLWVTNFADGTVTQINIPSNHPVRTVHVGSGPDAIAAGPAGLWVANSGDNTIQRIDPATGVPGVPVDVGDGPDGLAVDDTSVWVANGRAGSVMRFNANSRQPMVAPITVGSGPRGIVRVGDDVWVADELSQDVTRIDTVTGATESMAVGDGPTAVAALAGSIWVADRYAGQLVRIDAEAPYEQTRYPVGVAAHGMAVVDGHLWVAAGAIPAASHRGGTLRVAAASLPGTYSGIDPARVYDPAAHQAIRIVYDGLLSASYTSADPQLLVPDLAISVPQPLDGGKTYVFNVRRGIRYSSGEEVHGSDFVRGVQRALLVSPRPDFYRGIVGAKACIRHPRSCDLSRGVVANDDTGVVQFHLTAPDPEFLYKLTLLVVPTPPGTPLRRLTSPLPGTGPYRVASYRRNKEFSLARNELFHEWSAAAQPAGFLDAITWVKVADTPGAADAVRQGRADLADLTPVGDDPAERGQLVDELKVDVPKLLHNSIEQTVIFGVVNSSVPPFDNLRARQAFNYAVDRTKAVELLGGPNVAVPTCQLFPPSLPAHRDYCPYTSSPQDGGYHGPDLAKARDLVKASGTWHAKVTVTDIIGDYNPPLDEFFVDVLRSIGYRATLRRYADSKVNEDFFYDPDSGIQVESGGWIADFPLPSNFYDIVSCEAGAGSYPFDYCNRHLDQRAAAAKAMLQTAPGPALRAWTAIEKTLTDRAAVLPLTTQMHWWINSEPVGNYEGGVVDFGPLLSQLWIK